MLGEFLVFGLVNELCIIKSSYLSGVSMEIFNDKAVIERLKEYSEQLGGVMISDYELQNAIDASTEVNLLESQSQLISEIVDLEKPIKLNNLAILEPLSGIQEKMNDCSWKFNGYREEVRRQIVPIQESIHAFTDIGWIEWSSYVLDGSEGISKKLDLNNLAMGGLPPDFQQKMNDCILGVPSCVLQSCLSGFSDDMSDLKRVAEKQLNSIIFNTSKVENQLSEIAESLTFLGRKALEETKKYDLSMLDSVPTGALCIFNPKIVDLLSLGKVEINLLTQLKTIRDLEPLFLDEIPSQLYNTKNSIEFISFVDKEDLCEDETRTVARYENEVGLIYYLGKLDRELLKMFYGAIEVLESKNPDRIRHFSISIRELLTHVLHILAPDNKVKSWTNCADHFHNGKLTRKARILYICRDIQTHSFDKYVNSKADSLINFIEIFQRGTHSKTTSYTEVELVALRVEAEGFLRFVLEIANS